MEVVQQDNRVVLYLGDCVEVMASLPASSVDAIVTDPPYGLEFMGKDWDAPWRATGSVVTDAASEGGFQDSGGGNPYSRSRIRYGVGEGFQLWCLKWATEALRVAKPGAHILAFGGTRMFHRLTCALEDAGWEIRDCVSWVYGSGFPKSLDVSKAIDDRLGAVRKTKRLTPRAETSGTMSGKGDTRPWIEKSREQGFHEVAGDLPVTPEADQWDGWGTALKPAWEPIIVARKPLEGTVAGNVLAYGTGALNIDGCRVGDFVPTQPSAVCWGEHYGAREEKAIPDTVGRWPSNLMHDGSPEVLACFPETAPSTASMRGDVGGPFCGLDGKGVKAGTSTLRGHNDDGGSAARFFYCAKASVWDRDEGLDAFELQPPTHGQDGKTEGLHVSGSIRPKANIHPTVKPTDLMRYLCRLVTPPGGVVMDPFLGSGSTGKAALLEGFRFIGMDMSAEYLAIAQARIAYAALPPEERLAHERWLRAQAEEAELPPDQGQQLGLF
jgi:DNA modification methylase